MNIRNSLSYIFFLSLISLFILSCNKEVTQKSDPLEERAQLMERIEEFNAAFGSGDVDKLELMITDNYLHTNGYSKAIGKSDWLAYLVTRKKELESGELIVKNYKMEETEIEFHNDMAIVTAKISFSTITPNEEKENEMRVTNVWVQEEGVWKRAAFHDTRIK
ncbi:MAG: nuclear transport factor 2 family protein [Cyclobacteriaceae bacterium]